MLRFVWWFLSVQSSVFSPQVSMLKAVGVLNPDLTNMVKFFEQFEHMGHTCLVFEMLDTSLYDLLLERDWKPLSLKQIRPIAKQVLLYFLFSMSANSQSYAAAHDKIQNNVSRCFVPAAVGGAGCPEGSRYPAHRHQTGQHYVCECAGPAPQGQINRLWRCHSSLQSPARDGSSTSWLQVGSVPLAERVHSPEL